MNDTKEKIEKVKLLIQKGDNDKAIELCLLIFKETEYENMFIELKSRHQNLRHKIVSGVISNQEETLEKNKIINSIILLLSNINQPLDLLKKRNNRIGIWERLEKYKKYLIIVLGIVTTIVGIISQSTVIKEKTHQLINKSNSRVKINNVIVKSRGNGSSSHYRSD